MENFSINIYLFIIDGLWHAYLVNLTPAHFSCFQVPEAEFEHALDVLNSLKVS